MRKNICLYFMYVSAILKSSMQYKASFFLMVIGRFFIGFNGFLGIYFLFSGFSDIKGYSYGEVLLCYSVMEMSFALSECFASGFAAFAGMIRRGEFDRVLVRPLSPILQVLGSRFDLGRIGPMMTGVIMLVFGIQNSAISWSPARILTLAFMILGGAVLFTGLFMVGASICFFSIEETRWLNILTYGGKEHGKYPIDVYGKNMMKFCTYVIPYTLVQYYPLQYLLGRTDTWQYALFPAGAVIFLVLSYVLWRFGVRHYKSSGS